MTRATQEAIYDAVCNAVLDGISVQTFLATVQEAWASEMDSLKRAALKELEQARKAATL